MRHRKPSNANPCRRVPGLLAAHVIAFGVLVAAPPAHAHTELERISPPAGGVVTLATDHLVLGFTDELVSVGSKVVVRDSTGTDVVVGDPAGSGPMLDVRLELTAPGRHSVAYRAVGPDGHVIAGTSWFRVSAEQSPRASATTPASRSAREPSEVVVAEIGQSSAGAFGGVWWWVVTATLGGLLLALHTRSRRRGRVLSSHRNADSSPSSFPP